MKIFFRYQAFPLIVFASALYLLCGGSPGFAGEEGNSLMFYYRGSSKPKSPTLDTMNVVYQRKVNDLFFGTIGGRLGEADSRLGQANYKLEINTAKFFDYFSFMARMAKINSFFPGAPNRQTNWMFMLYGRYKLNDHFSFTAAGGTVNSLSSETASIGIPTFSGRPNWMPAFYSAVKYHHLSAKRSYSLKFANYDVFDTYPSTQPYFQIQTDQDLEKLSIFTYVRYRFRNTVTRYYSLYIALGIVFPLDG